MADLENVLDEGPRMRRAYRRAERPTIGWAYGLLLIVALVSLFVVALTVVARDIEREVANTARRALDQAGLDEVEVAANGQSLMLVSADDGQLLKAADLLSTFRYPSWVGAVEALAERSDQAGAAVSNDATQAPSQGTSAVGVSTGTATNGQGAVMPEGSAVDPRSGSLPSAVGEGLMPTTGAAPALELASVETSISALREGANTGAASLTGSGTGTGTGEATSGSEHVAGEARDDLAVPSVIPAAATVEPDVPMVAPHFLFIRNGPVLTLTGVMTSSMTRDALLATARAIVASDAGRPTGLRTLEGDVTVASAIGTVATEPIDPMPPAVRGLALLRRCIEGRASLQGGVFRFRGAAPAEEVSVLEESARAPIAGTEIGLVEFTRVQAAEHCEQLLTTAAADLKIEFVGEGSVMQATSSSQLDHLAELLETCPVPLRVEGHPAGRKRASAAQSLRRARAVRDALVSRGVDGDQLSVHGSGMVAKGQEHAYPIAIRVLSP